MDKASLPTIIEWFKSLQNTICDKLENLDGQGRFIEDLYTREEGGGGRSRVIHGDHIEKGGVMFSAIHGPMPSAIASGLEMKPGNFNATGVSIVLHPRNPWVPIIHMNIRYFEKDDGLWWFGGGIDVTPHYIIPAQAKDFHLTLKEVCDGLNDSAYAEYKKWADDYFYNVHRKETRGIGGIFFDRLNQDSGHSKEECWAFVQDVGRSFMKCYEALFLLNYQKAFTADHQKWQEVRRGRYVEFNLVYDRGTKFGLKTNGRIESILMSMPPQAQWVYNFKPSPDSLEHDTLKRLVKNINYIEE